LSVLPLEVHVRKSCIAAGFAVTLVGPVLLATPALAADGTYTGTVVEVIDGDSILVDLDDGPVQNVRLVGVDADEDYQCYYSEAKEHAESLLLGEDVTLKKDKVNDQTDRRLFAYVYVGDDLINYRQIIEGYARERAYGPDYELRPQFKAAHQEAKRAGVGLWDDCS
jgi:micrococcal nuclease